MPSMRIVLEGGDAWPDLAAKVRAGMVDHVKGHMEVAALAFGMTSGRPSVAFRIDLPNGRTVIAETSLELFVAAGKAFAARHGDGSAPPG